MFTNINTNININNININIKYPPSSFSLENPDKYRISYRLEIVCPSALFVSVSPRKENKI